MNDCYPDYNTYSKLYARFLEKDCGGIFGDISLKDKTVLDLCCGSGRLSHRALEMGAKQVVAVDREPAMIGKCCSDTKIDFIIEGVHFYLMYVCPSNSYDIVVCQQAVNYWFDEDIIKSLVKVLKKDGVFVFNTFNKKPSELPTMKEYVLGGKLYFEVSYLDGDIVYHFQSAQGIKPHLTSFQWISPEKFHEILLKYFKVIKEYVNGNTSIYHCFK